MQGSLPGRFEQTGCDYYIRFLPSKLVFRYVELSGSSALSSFRRSGEYKEGVSLATSDVASGVKPAPVRRRSNWARQARDLHSYLGIFFSPAILFFALTGAVQLVGLHEAHPGQPYQPPAWLQRLAQVHIHQTVALPPKRVPPPAAERARQPQGGEPGPGQQQGERRRRPQTIGTTLSKAFFLLMSLGLLGTTSLGIYLAFKFNRNRRLTWTLLAVGTLLPVAFTFF